MRKLGMMIGALCLSAGAVFADPAEGVWKTEPGDTGGYLHVNVYGCGEALCGVIRKAFDAQGKANDSYEHLNKRMLWDMQPEGGGQYGGGKIWAADRGKTYNSKMSLNGNTLNVEGCVAVFCRGQSWTRVQ